MVLFSFCRVYIRTCVSVTTEQNERIFLKSIFFLKQLIVKKNFPSIRLLISNHCPYFVQIIMRRDEMKILISVAILRYLCLTPLMDSIKTINQIIQIL